MPKVNQNRWVVKPKGDDKVVAELQKSLDIPHTVANLLVQRGIHNFDEAKAFFRPSLNQLHDPFLMKNMAKAVKRIEKALKNKENILIYGDYDVDGTSAVALVYHFFSQLTQNISYYIPDRYEEGYGISFQSIDFAKDNNISLIIALDCGIKAVEKVAYANEKSIDYIICDHHLPGKEIPDALAVLDPKQADCKYPYKELCGAGVGFKLVQAYAAKNNISEEHVFDLLDILTIAIAADIVPITGENRVLSHFGLKKINEQPRPGIAALFEVAVKEHREIVNSDLVFVAAPRINAAGRMESGILAVDLLTSGNKEDAIEIAKKINENNADRKDEDKKMTQEALDIIAEDVFLQTAKSSVLYQPHWHKGVIGIVASRVIETYYRPTIILTKSGDKVAGSARSVKGYNVYNAIEACSDLITQFGGHKYAAGLTMLEENVEAFRQKFDQVVSSTILEEQLTPEITIDAEITLDELVEDQKNGLPKLYRLVEQFQPFGPGNMTPVFCLKNVIDSGNSRIVGDNHLKLSITHPDFPKISIDGIAFNMGENFEGISQKTPFDVVFSLDKNVWNGFVSLQLRIRDIRLD